MVFSEISSFALATFLFFEVYYFLRFIIVFFYYKFTVKESNFRSIEEESVYYGICTTNDLDMNLHMNNSRYLREMDFARINFMVKNGLVPVIRRHGKHVVLSASTIRYRRAITLFQVYRIRTKMIYWNDRSFYLEHRMETIHDNFVRAVVLCKQTMIGMTVDEVFKGRLGHTLPSPAHPPAQLMKWIECNEISSENMKQEFMTKGQNKVEQGDDNVKDTLANGASLDNGSLTNGTKIVEIKDKDQ